MPKKKGKKGKKDKKKASRKQSIYEELSPPNFGTPVSSQDSDGSLASWSDHDKKWAFRDLRDLEETLAKGEKQYDTECILRYRRHPRQGYGQYRTKWEGFPIHSCTWEPENHFDPEVIQDFWAEQGGRPDDAPPVDYDDDTPQERDSDTDVLKWDQTEEGSRVRRKVRLEFRRDKKLFREWRRKVQEQKSMERAARKRAAVINDSDAEDYDDDEVPIYQRHVFKRRIITAEESPHQSTGSPLFTCSSASPPADPPSVSLAETEPQVRATSKASELTGTSTSRDPPNISRLAVAEPLDRTPVRSSAGKVDQAIAPTRPTPAKQSESARIPPFPKPKPLSSQTPRPPPNPQPAHGKSTAPHREPLSSASLKSIEKSIKGPANASTGSKPGSSAATNLSRNISAAQIARPPQQPPLPPSRAGNDLLSSIVSRHPNVHSASASEGAPSTLAATQKNAFIGAHKNRKQTRMLDVAPPDPLPKRREFQPVRPAIRLAAPSQSTKSHTETQHSTSDQRAQAQSSSTGLPRQHPSKQGPTGPRFERPTDLSKGHKEPPLSGANAVPRPASPDQFSHDTRISWGGTARSLPHSSAPVPGNDGNDDGADMSVGEVDPRPEVRSSKTSASAGGAERPPSLDPSPPLDPTPPADPSPPSKPSGVATSSDAQRPDGSVPPWLAFRPGERTIRLRTWRMNALKDPNAPPPWQTATETIPSQGQAG